MSFPSTDGLNIMGDYYASAGDDAPLILLFHQANYSRGEYREIAPRLNDLGYSCLAIDQRSGDKVNGVLNETYRQAKQLELRTEYIDAIPDLEAAIKYATSNLADSVIIWGSSYSSALVFYMAVKHSDKVSAVLSFAPGEYLEPEGQTIESFAASLNCPVFITSAKNEHEQWNQIFQVIPSRRKVSFLPQGEGVHGSKALWESSEDHEEYWEAVESFLVELNHYSQRKTGQQHR